MTTPLLHLTPPADGDPRARSAPRQIALECLASLDEWHLRRSLRQAERGLSDVVLPPLYASGVTYQAPSARVGWLDLPEVIKRGAASSEGLAAWRAAELRVSGVDAEPVTERRWIPGRRGTGRWSVRAAVRHPDGRVEDPARILGAPEDDGVPEDEGNQPLIRLSMPDSDDGSHFAPLQIALEGLAQIDEWQIRRSLRRAQKGLSSEVLPPLYASGVVYREEAPGHEDWPDVPKVIAAGWGDCEDLAAWRAAELRVAGIECEPVIKWQWVPREMMIAQGYPASKLPDRGVWMVHCCVRFPDGHVEDPSKILGMGGNFTNTI